MKLWFPQKKQIQKNRFFIKSRVIVTVNMFFLSISNFIDVCLRFHIVLEVGNNYISLYLHVL